jgi:hypothetical protein
MMRIGLGVLSELAFDDSTDGRAARIRQYLIGKVHATVVEHRRSAGSTRRFEARATRSRGKNTRPGCRGDLHGKPSDRAGATADQHGLAFHLTTAQNGVAGGQSR